MPALREIFAHFGITFDQRPLERGARQVNAMTTRVRQLGSLLAGSIVVRGMGRFIQSTIDAADDLDKTSQQLGLTTAELQGFRHAAQLSGVDAAAFGNSLGQLQRRAHDAATGGSESAEAFRELGMDVRGANGELLSGSELLRGVAEGLSRLDNDSQRTALAMELMGRSGRRLLPMFSRGAAGLDDMAAELERLGGGVSQDFIDRAVEINDNMTRWRLSFMSLRSSLLVAILPTLNRVVETLTGWTARLSRMPNLVRILTAVMALLGVAAVAAAVSSAAAWLAAGWPILAAAVAVGVLYLAFQDLWTTLRGGDSVLRQFINELFPGMVGGLDATDRAIMTVVGTLAAAQAALAAFGQFWTGVMMNIAAQVLRPIAAVLALAGMIRRVASGEGLGAAASAALEASQRVPGGGGATFEQFSRGGLDAMASALGSFQGLREGSAAARSDVRDRALRLAGGELRLRGSGAPPARVEQKVDARSTVSVTVQEASNPAETERAVRRGVRDELGRAVRQLVAATPGGSS